MNADGQTPPVLECSTILLRLIANRNWISQKTGGILPKAFLLRSGNESRAREVTLSLVIKASCTLHEAFRTVLTDVYGMGSLHRGRILDLNLIKEVQDKGINLEVDGELKPNDDRRIFACIKNMPHKDIEPEKASLIADLLASSEQVRLVPLEDILAEQDIT